MFQSIHRLWSVRLKRDTWHELMHRLIKCLLPFSLIFLIHHWFSDSADILIFCLQKCVLPQGTTSCPTPGSIVELDSSVCGAPCSLQHVALAALLERRLSVLKFSLSYCLVARLIIAL